MYIHIHTCLLVITTQSQIVNDRAALTANYYYLSRQLVAVEAENVSDDVICDSLYTRYGNKRYDHFGL